MLQRPTVQPSSLLMSGGCVPVASRDTRDVKNEDNVGCAITGIVMGAGLVVATIGWIGLLLLVLTGAVVYGLKVRNERIDEERRVAAEEAAEKERRDFEAAQQAQVDHHVRMLCRADPLFVSLVEEWNRIPLSRPDARRRTEAKQAERLDVINQYARHFAKLERTGQLVPDHGETMRDLYASEQAWDAR